ncbi:hypothetical protein BJ508DRAFT_311925 [Ascobolus immersus RN42]|uniref:Uncharacterized protein n=1 Tax=Ascobolus immersus RN42 TaxID=1160509 RepID=A0A3N4HUM0_ASCIM|nr:hypothetical protein BJ508DRAFT_311925 [Ascobolus immersus RN42]
MLPPELKTPIVPPITVEQTLESLEDSFRSNIDSEAFLGADLEQELIVFYNICMNVQQDNLDFKLALQCSECSKKSSTLGPFTTLSDLRRLPTPKTSDKMAIIQYRMAGSVTARVLDLLRSSLGGLLVPCLHLTVFIEYFKQYALASQEEVPPVEQWQDTMEDMKKFQPLEHGATLDRLTEVLMIVPEFQAVVRPIQCSLPQNIYA